MTDFNNLIFRLEKFSDIIQKAIISTAIVEALMVIILGIISNNLNTEDQTINRMYIPLKLTTQIRSKLTRQIRAN